MPLRTMLLLLPLVEGASLSPPRQDPGGATVVPSYRTSNATLLAARSTQQRDPDVAPANVLFLMCDSMDGRVLDPTGPLYERLEMPNLRRLAARCDALPPASHLALQGGDEGAGGGQGPCPPPLAPTQFTPHPPKTWRVARTAASTS